MSDEPREHTRPLRDYRGEQPTEPILRHGPAGPWKAEVTLAAVEIRGYATRNHFQVAARWFGPPLPGSPPADRPVQATDVLVTDDLELGRQVAGHAFDQLRASVLPDLRALAAQLRARA